MKDNINFDIFTENIQEAISKTFESMPLDELKKIDWLTLETDFFIEKDKIKAA